MEDNNESFSGQPEPLVRGSVTDVHQTDDDDENYDNADTKPNELQQHQPQEEEEQHERMAAYEAVTKALLEPGEFLAPIIPSVVNLEFLSSTRAPHTPRVAGGINHNNHDLDEEDEEEEAERVTIITPSRGHHELFKRLEELDGLEKEESTLLELSELTQFLTSVVTEDTTYTSSRQAVQHLLQLGQAVPRRVCQHPFRKNDIVWVCRTCQADETCVLCHNCFSQSNHEGHDVAFYHAQAGGCCDCGDPDAWDPRGFCPYHGPGAAPTSKNTTSSSSSSSSLSSLLLSPHLVNRVRGVVPACVDWMVNTVAKNAEQAYSRANPTTSTTTSAAAALRHMPSQPLAGTAAAAAAATTTSTLDTGLPPVPMRTMSLPLEETAPPSIDTETPTQVQPQHDGTAFMVANLPTDDPMELSFSPNAASGEGRHQRQRLLLLQQQGESTTASSSSTADAVAAPTTTATASNTVAISAAEALGQLGCQQRGLYIVLLADDVHSSSQLLEALRDFWGNSNFYTDTLLQKLLRALKQYGQLVLWGVDEMITECGINQVQLWKDGDRVACARIGSIALERASRLSRRGLFCCICTGHELRIEQRAVHILQWLSTVARSCDPLCQTVAECILPNRHLVPLLRADFKMSARVTKAWYSLLLTLLAIPTFKSHLAAAYCDTYRNVTAKYARGLGVLERTGYTLSVQFLNRVTYVVDLVQGRDLLGKLGKAIYETLEVATLLPSSPSTTMAPFTTNRRLNPSHPVLTHRRYSPCVSDLKCVLNVHGMPRVVACENATFLNDWISSLALAQWMDPHVWRHWTLGHVENESRGWVGAFNASISLGSLFERLLGWSDDDASPITDQSSPYARGLLSCAEMTYRVLRQVGQWQMGESLSYSFTLPTAELHRRAPQSLPLSTVATKHGSFVAMRQIGISQSTPFSFHLPLHRFVSSCLRELCVRPNDSVAGMIALSQMLQSRLSEKELDDLFAGLLEYPTLILSRAAQIRSGLWRRSGPGVNDQVLNYSEPPFCRTMRDADLLMVQFAVLARPCRYVPDSDVGITNFMHLLLHRLGIFDFCGLAKAPTWHVDKYLIETERGLYRRELKVSPDQTSEDDVVLPWTYSPARDSGSCMVLLEEFLHLIIIFTSELPLPAPENRSAHTKQAQWKLFREVVHRLASGPKTHSELSEVQHVLSHWDNTLLSEEGKLINPDDATTASLGTCLKEIAIRKTSGRLEPDKWEMKTAAWDAYDPAFFHISLRHHQTAAENRPKPEERPTALCGWEPRPYTPKPPTAHSYFQRLRRDVTADATVLAVVYRVLHIHCRQSDKSLTDVLGRNAYDEKSETALARVCHILTLGAYAWSTDSIDATKWQEQGGGSVGSIFFDRSDAPKLRDWIHLALLAPPETLLDSAWYTGEEPILMLLQRLATSGGGARGFVAQDCSVRAGAAWLCDFCVRNCPTASSMLGRDKVESSPTPGETEMERRKREAKEKAMARMQAQAAKFASMMDVEMESEEEVDQPVADVVSPHLPPARANSIGSARSSASSAANSSFSDASIASGPMLPVESIEAIPRRLLRVRPRCIICNYDESDDVRQDYDDGEGQRKRSRRKSDNALGFVGYAQPSTVLKSGGGPPPPDPLSFKDHTGCFVQICSHAVHLSCCESYLATVSHREDRVGKRDEFRCPLCQRLSNCLVPFIDVGVDWIDSPSMTGATDGGEMAQHTRSLHDYLSGTPWWVTRRSDSVVWDGQSAFVDRTETPIETTEELAPTRRTSRRRLKKKDLYAAWNAMMRTPRFVRQRLRPRGRDNSSSAARGHDSPIPSEPEDSSGETLVWRRFMDQISDITYRADSKRLGDDRLHDYFGEFRHNVVEKYAYNMANQFITGSPVDWPSCMFRDPLPDTKRQEMSREKLLSKLLLTVQCFTYSVACEAYEARRIYRKMFPSSSEVANLSDSGDSVLSRFGISGVVCDGKLIVMPKPSAQEEDGTQPFDGRLGKLRYFALAVMAAAGAVAVDLFQLVLPLPAEKLNEADDEHPLRSPVAEPLLFGHVLTHVVAAMCASCGRGRARSDALDVSWPAPLSNRGTSIFAHEGQTFKTIDSVADDCEAFIKLGLLARVLQVLLAKLRVPPLGLDRPRSAISNLQSLCEQLEKNVDAGEMQWIRSCVKLLGAAFSSQMKETNEMSTPYALPDAPAVRDACMSASAVAAKYLVDAGVVLQLLVPGVMAKYEHSNTTDDCQLVRSPFEQVRCLFRLETIDEMLDSSLTREVVSNWFDTACEHAKSARGSVHDSTKIQTLRQRLYRTQGFRYLDWPSAGTTDSPEGKASSLDQVGKFKDGEEGEPQDDDDEDMAPASPMQIEHFRGSSTASATTTTTTEILHSKATPTLVTFSSKKTVPLLGGFSPDATTVKAGPARPRVAVMPTSYTDLYAELGTLLPECEQTAVCLICGEVLNAGGKGECTKHSYKCGAGAGLFFLLQECSGLIMHKSKAAYIHSPYVDSHGETPQFRGRPLNLDLVRYEHLRELWTGHSIRQTVVAERGSSRQVILPDFY